MRASLALIYVYMCGVRLFVLFECVRLCVYLIVWLCLCFAWLCLCVVGCCLCLVCLRVCVWFARFCTMCWLLGDMFLCVAYSCAFVCVLFVAF